MQQIESAWEAARQVWPEIAVPADRYRDYVAARTGDHLNAADLYLACACAEGDVSAIVAFERALFPLVDRVVHRMRAPAGLEDEVKQALRARLFVPTAARAAQIAEYSGKGSLAGWFKIVALRETLAILRRSGRERRAAGDPVPLLEGAAGPDPQLAYMRREFGAHLREALEQALAGLSVRDRTLMRLYHVDQVGVEALGAAYSVHAGTISRWLAAARASVLKAVQRSLRQTLGADQSELESLMRLVDSQLELSLSNLLPRTDGARS